MSAADMFGARSGFSKYRAVKTIVDNIVFDSKAEAKRYGELKLLSAAGEISKLELQPVFPLGTDEHPVLIRSPGFPKGRRAKYTADFAYTDRCGARIIEDVKGMDTTESRLRRAFVEAQYGIRIIVTGARK